MLDYKGIAKKGSGGFEPTNRQNLEKGSIVDVYIAEKRSLFLLKSHMG